MFSQSFDVCEVRLVRLQTGYVNWHQNVTRRFVVAAYIEQLQTYAWYKDQNRLI